MIHLLNYDGSVRANYAYDAWGKILSVTDANGNEITDPNHMGRINPIRYRGYYYDEETGLYYLNSRYYDPVVGRFLNADSEELVVASMGSPNYDKNLFAYCDNNPVVRADNGGGFWNFVIGAVVGGVISGAVQAISNIANGKEWHDGVLIAAAVGAVNGAVAASGLGIIAQAGISAVVSGGGNAVQQGFSKGFDNIDYGEAAYVSVISFGTSVAGSKLGYKITEKLQTTAMKNLNQGANRVVNGQQRYLSGSRYWKGAVKQGTKQMNTGAKQLNTARGVTSVIGSGVGAITGLGSMSVWERWKFYSCG